MWGNQGDATTHNLAVQFVEGTLVVVHNERAPNDEDWEVFMQAWRAHLDDVRVQLVFSDGGAPNSEQRRASLELIASRRGGPPPTAVLTASLLGRGVVTALAWFIKDRIRAFAPGSLSEACAFLSVAHQEPQLRQCVGALRRRVSLHSLASSGNDRARSR